MAGSTAPSTLPAPAVALRARLLEWYDRHRRDLPWRAPAGRLADPWAVLVSEVMLQQTTVATVLGRYPAFLKLFPTPMALAAAPLEAVLHAWQGLGYYRRARALHECARAIVDRHGGRLPDRLEALRALPGLGPYTAAAVAAIALGQPAVPVDGNVLRVLCRLGGVTTPLPAARRIVDGLAGELADAVRAGDLAQALMELGALVCRPQSPACDICPWAFACVAKAGGEPAALPRRAASSPRPSREGLAFLLQRPDGAVLFRRRGLVGLLPGMVELPSTPWDRADSGRSPEDPLAWAPVAAEWQPVPGAILHVFTHFALTMRIVRATADAPLDGLWTHAANFSALALPTLTSKLLALAGLTEGCLDNGRSRTPRVLAGSQRGSAPRHNRQASGK